MTPPRNIELPMGWVAFYPDQIFPTYKVDTRLFHLPCPSYDVMVCGGAVRRAIAGEKFEGSDIDLVFTSPQARHEYQARLLLRGWKIHEYHELYTAFVLHNQIVQCLHATSPNIVAALMRHDLTVTQFGQYLGSEVVYAPLLAIVDHVTKRLRINNVHNATINRVQKYSELGYGTASDIIVAVKSVNSRVASDAYLSTLKYAKDVPTGEPPLDSEAGVATLEDGPSLSPPTESDTPPSFTFTFGNMKFTPPGQ